MSLCLLLILLISERVSDTRYFKDIYNFTTSNGYPRPLDICLLNSNNDYVIYTCNKHLSEYVLTEQNFGDNRFCNSTSFSIFNYTKYTNETDDMDDDLFNCIGEDNYVINYNFQSFDECELFTLLDQQELIQIMDTIEIQYYATDVCLEIEIENFTASTRTYYCNGIYGSRLVQPQSDECVYDPHAFAPTIEKYQSRTVCTNYTYATSQLMHKCVVNGKEVTMYDYQDYSHQIQLYLIDRVALIDFYIATSNFPWATYYCQQFGDQPWNLRELAVNGTFKYWNGTDYRYICGIDQTVAIETVNGDTTYIIFSLQVSIIKGMLLDGYLPESLCDFFYLYKLSFIGQPWVHGGLPACIGEYPLSIFEMTFTSITEIPYSFCNTTYTLNPDFHYITIQLNDKLIELPACFGDLSMTNLWIVGQDHITGTLPSSIFCSNKTQGMVILNNTFDEQSIPSCFSNMTSLVSLALSNSSFSGKFPVLPKRMIQYINLGHSNFEGSISQIFAPMLNEPQLFNDTYEVLLSNNNFHDRDISNFLEILLLNAPQLGLVTLSNNPNIKGTLPDLNMIFTFTKHHPLLKTGLIFHGCSISGRIPQNLKFRNMDYLTLHNNRISGYIPDDFRNYNNSADPYESMILLGNLLWTKTNQVPNWVNSPLNTAVNIYYNQIQQVMDIIIIIFAFIGLVTSITFIFRKFPYFEEEQKLIKNFFASIEAVCKLFGDWRLLLISCVLIVFYPLTAGYWKSIPYGALFSVSWYQGNDQNHEWINWILLVLAIGYQAVLLFVVERLIVSVRDLQRSHDATAVEEIELQESGKRFVGAGLAQADQFRCDNNLNAVEHKKCHKCKSILIAFAYFILWILGMICIVAYVMASSLPDDNSIGIGYITAQIIAKSITLVLIINNRYIIPGLAKKIASICSGIKNFNYWIIVVLRLNNALIVPFIASIFLLSDCGNYWVKYWNYCTDDQLRNKFDITVIDVVVFAPTTLLNPDDACASPSLQDMNFNKCLRAFLYNWTRIMMIKLLVQNVVQFLGVLGKCLKEKFLNKEIKILIDVEYIGITINLVISIIFSFVSPLIIIINILQIIIKLFLYKLMRYKLKWKFKIALIDDNLKLPVGFLWIGIIFGQFIITLFFVYSIEESMISWMLISIIILMDIICVYNRVRNNTLRDQIIDNITIEYQNNYQTLAD